MLNASLADEGMKYEDFMPKPSICGFKYYNVQQDETAYSVTTRRLSGLDGRIHLPDGALQACSRYGQQKGRAHRSVAALSDGSA